MSRVEAVRAFRDLIVVQRSLPNGGESGASCPPGAPTDLTVRSNRVVFSLEDSLLVDTVVLRGRYLGDVLDLAAAVLEQSDGGVPPASAWPRLWETVTARPDGWVSAHVNGEPVFSAGAADSAAAALEAAACGGEVDAEAFSHGLGSVMGEGLDIAIDHQQETAVRIEALARGGLKLDVLSRHDRQRDALVLEAPAGNADKPRSVAAAVRAAAVLVEMQDLAGRAGEGPHGGLAALRTAWEGLCEAAALRFVGAPPAFLAAG